MWDKLLDRRIGFQLGLLQTLLQIGIAVCLALTVGYLARRHTLELEIEGLHGRNKTAIAAFTSSVISRNNRVRFSREPPYSS